MRKKSKRKKKKTEFKALEKLIKKTLDKKSFLGKALNLIRDCVCKQHQSYF